MQSSSNKIDWHLTSCFAYFIFSVTFGVFWSKNFGILATKKGEDFFYLIGYDILLAFIFFVLFAAIKGSLRMLFLLVIPILSIIPTLIITIITLLFRLTGNSTDATALFTYGIIYPGVTLSIYLFILKKGFK